jgi:putative transposase
MPKHPIDPLEIAAFRHRLIAAAIEADGDGVAAALRESAAQLHRHPDGNEIRVSLSTLWAWLAAHRRGGILALQPCLRKDRATLRAFPKPILAYAVRLRRENPQRSTRTVIDIMVRDQVVARGQVARSTLDRHLDRLGASRRHRGTLAKATFRLIETKAPMELVVGDFHHGPYIRVGPDEEVKRALFLGFIDHYSRLIVEGRYYLTEDFAALRFGFRQLLAVHGLPAKLYLDNGPAFQAIRFHAACDGLGIQLLHSKPYVAESRGVIERFNRTLKEQFESEVRIRETPPTLEELNAWLQAWLAERYHDTAHAMTGQRPAERFGQEAAGRPAPPMKTVEEFLRLREVRTVHRKLSTVEVMGQRFAVSPGLRGRKVQVLYDPADLAYVLIVYDGRVIEHALAHKPGVAPEQPAPEPPLAGKPVDYLARLLSDHEGRRRAELSALRMQAPVAVELDLPGLVALLEACRGVVLTDPERSEAAAFRRRLRPMDPVEARQGLEGARRRLGPGLHLSQYLQALEAQMVRTRTAARKAATPKGQQP